VAVVVVAMVAALVLGTAQQVDLAVVVDQVTTQPMMVSVVQVQPIKVLQVVTVIQMQLLLDHLAVVAEQVQ
jgi:hypothetical protein